MNNESLNDSNVDPTDFLDGTSDPPLNAVHLGTTNRLNGNNGNNGVGGEQIGIRDLAERMEEIMQRMNDRDAVIFERINSLEQNSSRGSQSSGTSIVAARPGENGFGVIPDQNAGNVVQNKPAATGNSPSYSNLTAPSAANSNSSGPGTDSRHGDKIPSNDNGQSAPNNTTGHYADPQHTRERTEQKLKKM